MKTTVVESLNDIFSSSHQQQRREQEDTSEGQRPSSISASKNTKSEKTASNQIQIEENTLEDDNIEIIDPLADKSQGSGANSARERTNSGEVNEADNLEDKDEELESPIGSSPS
mmetsp:Transcript_14226/g.22156  ORF Transcript_14226/g.22156 Transcript_14226/m.22156 type:complete len:114 (+) Transcript_14226:98-439(+)